MIKIAESVKDESKRKPKKKRDTSDARAIPTVRKIVARFNSKRSAFSDKYLNGEFITQDQFLTFLLGERSIVKVFPSKKRKILKPKVCPCCEREFDDIKEKG